jgi:hypothetical protein
MHHARAVIVFAIRVTYTGMLVIYAGHVGIDPRRDVMHHLRAVEHHASDGMSRAASGPHPAGPRTDDDVRGGTHDGNGRTAAAPASLPGEARNKPVEVRGAACRT